MARYYEQSALVQPLDRLRREVVQCIDSGLGDEERGSPCDS